MRDTNLTTEQLSVQLERSLRKNLQELVLTEAVFVNPNLEYEVTVNPLPRKLNELKALVLASYYSPDSAFGFFLREKVEERISHYDLGSQLQLEILLSGRREILLNYLILNESLTERAFFGNWVPLAIQTFNRLKLKRRKLRKPVEPVYRRGYKDKGSRRPEFKWLPTYDFSFTERQNELERIDDQYQAYLTEVLEILSSEANETLNS